MFAWLAAGPLVALCVSDPAEYLTLIRGFRPTGGDNTGQAPWALSDGNIRVHDTTAL